MTEHSTCVGQQLIGSQWVIGAGTDACSISPVDGRESWHGRWADSQQAADAINAAQSALARWSLRPLGDRQGICRAFAKHVEAHRDELADLISWETGKPLWEALTEVATVIGKIEISIEAQQARRWTSGVPQADLTAVTRYRPHGVMVVLGPFNLPAHLPGAHIVPALLAGNTVVFKPSELTPAVGQWLAHAWQAAGLPSGALNLIHGDADIARTLASDDRVAGVLFTGSYRAGASLHRLLAGRPEVVLALEMGGNNPLVVHNVSNLASAAMQIIESAYITSGQRCTCARRLIVTESSQPDHLLAHLRAAIDRVRVGLPSDQPQPFMGTLIRDSAAQRMLEAQAALLSKGARAVTVIQPSSDNRALLTPGLLETTGIELEDVEHFGPLLCVTRVPTLEEAITTANRTRFGLAAGLLADNAHDYEFFCQRIRAGIVNWNRQTTGASGRLPFGGVGASGNHAPSGYFAADYCAYPVASLESQRLPDVTTKVLPGLEEAVRACSLN